MEDKSYCSKCIYYVSDVNKVSRRPEFADTNYLSCCMAPQNIKDTNVNKYSDMFISNPTEINKFNNCRWYSPIENVPNMTRFGLSNLLYGAHRFQMINDGNTEYTLDLLNSGKQTYSWQSTFKELLWNRDLYKTLNKNTKYYLSGTLKNSNLCDIIVTINLLVETSYGIKLPISEITFELDQDDDIVFSNFELVNNSKFYEIALRDNDKLIISFTIDPKFDKNSNCSGECSDCNLDSSGETDSNPTSSGESDFDCNPNCSGEDDSYLWNIEFENMMFEIQ